MRANIANFVRHEIRVPKKNSLLPVFEAISNALDAINDGGQPGTARISILRHPPELDGSPGLPCDIIIDDDGVGFTDANLASFNELFSNRKISVGGKGRGRFTYLKVFEAAIITSRFKQGDKLIERRLNFDLGYVPESLTEIATVGSPGTRVVLRGMREEYAKEVPKDQETLLRRFIWHFLPLILSGRRIEIVLVDGEEVRLVEYVRNVLQIQSQKEVFAVAARQFQLTHILMCPRSGMRHRFILAASLREVDDGFRLVKAMPVLGDGPLKHPEHADGFIYVALVQGNYLDDSVDSNRLGFVNDDAESGGNEDVAVPSEEPADLLGDPKSIGQVRTQALDRVKKFLEPFTAAAIASRAEAINAYIRSDGMGYHFLRSEVPEIAKTLKTPDAASIEASLHRAAFEERKKRKREAQNLLSTTPKEKAEQSYFDRWHKIVGKLSDVAKSDLAGYVAHRRAIIDLVDDVIKSTPEGNHRREEVLHSIVFPQGKQSGEVSYEQQNLWLIDERLAFHEHLYSDRTIKEMSGREVDSRERPDLAIFESGFAGFHDEGKPPANIVLVELKRPARTDVSRDDPVRKTLSYVKKIKSGNAYTEGGSIIDIEPGALTTVYLLADWTADFREYLKNEDFLKMPGDHAQYRHHTNENITFIALSFSRLIENARMRNRIFFRKLGIE